jgi:hypothetical protein
MRARTMDIQPGDAGYYGTPEAEERNWIPTIEQIAPGLADVADRIRVQGEGWIEALSRAAGQVAMADYQRRLLNVQLERARQGLPPLDASQYGVGVNVQAPQLNTLLILGAVGIVAVLVLLRR